MMNNDSYYIEKCFELARNAKGLTSPNPLVGSVVVNNGKIIGQGFHLASGSPHAEVMALNNVEEKDKQLIQGSTLYCNLEPCCHSNKKTDPCVDLLIKSKIAKIVISNIDPNPSVNGAGIEKLKKNGISVITGINSIEGKELNKVFFKNMTQKKPYITLKMAASLDGRIALESGSSKWITCEESRKLVHEMRFENDAVMVGINTFIFDKPKLNSRNNKDEVVKENKKIIIGKWKNEYTDLFSSFDKDNLTFINCSPNIKVDGPINIINLVDYNNSLEEVFIELFKQGICSILVEGGAITFSKMLDLNLYDEIYLFYAPVFLGNGKQIYINEDNKIIKKLEGTNAIGPFKSGSDFYIRLKKE